jgi:cell wall-associated NlpC family hydrolase
MTGLSRRACRHLSSGTGIICFALLLGACSLMAGKKVPVVARPVGDLEIEDVGGIPQKFSELANAAGDRLTIGAACRTQLHDEFKLHFFTPWTSSVPLFDPAESADFMKKESRGRWYGPNKRKVAQKQLQALLQNCALDGFPSRNDKAIAVAPGHLRGLPTHLPLYERADDAPFDMLSYPQVKLNEPLRVLHVSLDGVWLFVETGYSNGWLETRDVAFVDRAFIESWMQAPQLAIVRDFAPVPDGRGVGTFRAKIGTVLPFTRTGEGWWEVSVASAGLCGKAERRPSRIPSSAAVQFPLEFNKENVALIGDQLLGQPYGWGEAYDLRDCSALLRDFFLPFGIWMPRTSADQIASVRQRLELAALAPPKKEELISSKALPFLTLLYKPGHIMLYVGVDRGGRPLVFHDAWSIRLKDGAGERKQIIGTSTITTLEPGKELGLVPGSSLLEKATELATITGRCR